MPAHDPGDRALLASIAAHERWAGCEDRAAATAAARRALLDRFERQARELFGDLPAVELAERAEHLRKAHYKRLALKSAQARRNARRLSAEADAADSELSRLAEDEQ